MVPQIFSPKRRIAIQARARKAGGGDTDWLAQRIEEEFTARLDFLDRQFERGLVIGTLGTLARTLVEAKVKRLEAINRADQWEALSRDRLPFDPQQFDLILAPSFLETANDLPGLLVQIRACLKPNGLFLGAILGEDTLSSLRETMLGLIEQKKMRAIGRLHPGISTKSANDLMARAGFDRLVVDLDGVKVRYSSWDNLRADLRAHGLTNALVDHHPLSRTEYDNLVQTIKNKPFFENFSTIYLSGWTR